MQQSGEGEGFGGDGLVRVWDLNLDQMISTPSLFLGSPELEQQRIAGQCLLLQLVETSPEYFQAPASHRAFFEGSGMASREDVELLVMRQEFDSSSTVEE